MKNIIISTLCIISLLFSSNGVNKKSLAEYKKSKDIPYTSEQTGFFQNFNATKLEKIRYFQDFTRKATNGTLESSNRNINSLITIAQSGEKFYGIAEIGETWEEAHSQIDTLRALYDDFDIDADVHLVTINSRDEQDLIYQGIVDSTTLNRGLIGLTDEETEGDWRWVTGEDFSYSNWRNGEPNNAGNGEDHAVINIDAGGAWDDASGSSNWNYIVEVTLNMPSQPNLVFLGEYNGSEYAASYDPISYHDLPSLVENLNNQESDFEINMVTITSHEENEFLSSGIVNNDTLPSDARYWTGLTDHEEEGIWRWWNSDEEVEYYNWRAGEPNGGTTENYVEIKASDGLWNDANQDSELLYILEGQYVGNERDVNVTFHVDMQNETVENGVWLAGGTAGNPGYEMMLMPDSDHLYFVTVMVPENTSFTYKFSNGPINADWSGPYEVVPAECGVGEYLDREVMVGGEDMMLPPVVFGTCGGDVGPGIVFFEKLDNADVTDPANWDMVTPSVAITRGNNGSLYNPLLEGAANPSISPEGTMWSYGLTGEITGYQEIELGEDLYLPFEEAYIYGAEQGFAGIAGKTLSMHCMEEDKFFDVTFNSWTNGGQGGQGGGGGFSYTRVEVDAPLNPVTDVNVTFYVDMQFETVENGVWLAGGTAGNPGYEMMQFELAPGFETIYNVTLTLEEGLAFSYKFVNGPIDENWGGAWEEVPAECGVGDFLDREILVQGDPEGNMFLPPVVFGECTVNLEAEVTFHVDMQYEFVDRGVFLAGGDAGNPGFEMFDEDGDHIYSLTLTLPTYDSFTYKFVNGPIDAGWQGGWEEVPAECGVGEFLDRQLLVGNLDEYELPAVVFGSCDEATNVVDVTFHVDMQFETVENGVWLAGGNAGNPGFEMMDEEGDNIYSITLTLPINEPYTYKFANGPINPDWSGPFEEVPAACGVGEYLDREVMVDVQSMNLPPVVFGSCTPEGVVLVTFNVDMQTENVDPDRGVWLAGGNAGNPGHEMMLLDMPGLQRIYTVTIPLESGTSFGYKFANGMINPDWSGNWEEVPAECGVGEYLDRQVIVGEMDMVLPPIGFGSCDVVPFPTAHITDVMDIPEDQGGRVYITFEKSRLDTDEPQRTEMYTIERLDGEQWVGLNSIGAYGSPIYTVEATTLGDSTSESMMMSTYRVVSNMDEGVFLSEPFSGHSVDNIAPMMLVGLDAGHSNGIVNLSWSPSEANDFSHYMIYYGSSPDFIPSPENLLGTSDSNPTFGHDVVEIGEHYYVVSAMDIHENESEYSEVASIALLSLVDVNGIPDNYTLHQNFPNPFNPTTQIKYELPSDALVNINIYDVMGRKIKSLTNSNQSAGYHSLRWDATNNIGEAVSAGMYIYTIQAGEYRSTKKMVLLK
jgi:hypothetical protein